MLQTFYELPQRAIERRGHSEFLATVGNGAIHEINFGLALGKNILQHAGFVLAGSIRAFLDESARIAVELDAKCLGDGFALGDQRVEERARLRESGGCAMVEQGESADRIGRGVEDKLGPLSSASVLKGNDFESRAIQELREFFDAGIRRVGRFERTDPGIAVDVEADVAGFDYMASRKRGATNDVAHVFREDFFIAYTVLHGANSAGVAEKVGGLLDSWAGVCALGRDNSEFADRNFFGVGRCVQARSEIGGAADAQATRVDGASMLLGNVVGVNFYIGEARKVGPENAADGAAADDADSDTHADFRASSPV